MFIQMCNGAKVFCQLNEIIVSWNVSGVIGDIFSPIIFTFLNTSLISSLNFLFLRIYGIIFTFLRLQCISFSLPLFLVLNGEPDTGSWSVISFCFFICYIHRFYICCFIEFSFIYYVLFFHLFLFLKLFFC